MRPFVKALRELDLAELAGIEPATSWHDDGRLLEALLGEARVEPLHAAVAALRAGAGVDRLLDVVVAAVSERMLRYEPAGEFDFHDDFGWLDITHGITYAKPCAGITPICRARTRRGSRCGVCSRRTGPVVTSGTPASAGG